MTVQNPVNGMIKHEGSVEIYEEGPSPGMVE